MAVVRSAHACMHVRGCQQMDMAAVQNSKEKLIKACQTLKLQSYKLYGVFRNIVQIFRLSLLLLRNL